MCDRKSRFMLGLFLAVLMFLQPSFAQQDTGTITGIVKDQSGAALPGVSVTVTNALTAASFRTVTDELGRYTAPALRVGQYAVLAESSGFKKVLRSGIVLQVNQPAQSSRNQYALPRNDSAGLL
jgi:hypothetical protein